MVQSNRQGLFTSKTGTSLPCGQAKQRVKDCGVGKQSMADFSSAMKENLCQLSKELKEGSYKPQPVGRVYIAKPEGEQKKIIPAIRDRVVQQSLLNVLQPIFDPDFHPSSYGYRPKRSAHHAIAKAERFSRHYDLCHVADMDLSKCFDTLDHQLILQKHQKVQRESKANHSPETKGRV